MRGLFGRLIGRAADPGAAGSELIGAGWGLSGAGVPVNAFTAMQHVAVMACVSIIAEDIAKLPLRMYRRLPNGGKTQVKDHYLARLLKRPNDWQDSFEFREMMMAALLLRSNAYAVIVRDERGFPRQLVPVHPDRVTLYEAPGGDWFYFVSRQGLHEMAVLSSLPIMIAAEDVFHLRWLSTWSSLLGTSRIGLMREAVGLAIGMEQQSARLIGQGARPSGVLQTETRLSKEAIERVRTAWQENYGGVRNAGKTVVLEEGLKWQPLAMTNVDAQFMESRRFQLEDIARAFRLPRHKLGLPVEGAASGLVQYEQAYLNDCLSSHCERWIPKLEELGGLDGDDYFVEFDYDHFLKADIQTRLNAKRTGVVGMIFTPNEARRGEGLPDVEGGDVLYQPTNVAPIGFTPGSSPGAGPGSDLSGAPAEGGRGDPATPPDTEIPGDQPAGNQ